MRTQLCGQNYWCSVVHNLTFMYFFSLFFFALNRFKLFLLTFHLGPRFSFPIRTTHYFIACIQGFIIHFQFPYPPLPPPSILLPKKKYTESFPSVLRIFSRNSIFPLTFDSFVQLPCRLSNFQPSRTAVRCDLLPIWYRLCSCLIH